MSFKIVSHEQLGEIYIYKRKGTKSAKIRIVGSEVKISIPRWMPYSYAMSFADQKKDWIQANRKPKKIINDTHTIADKYILSISQYGGSRILSSSSEKNISIKIPSTKNVDSAEVQKKITKICEHFLLIESKKEIPIMINQLALENNFKFNSLNFKKLKSRWGSCDRNKNITINSHLIQLPENLIKYILIHELAHTEHMNHGSFFWKRVEVCLPNFKNLKKELKKYAPEVLI